MKKKIKILAIALCIFFISPLSIPFSKTKNIGELFQDMNEIEILYTNKYSIFEDTGKIQMITWKLEEYPEKQSDIERVLNQYFYYNRKYKKNGEMFKSEGSMLSLRLVDKDTDIIIFNNTYEIVNGDAIYIIGGGKKNAEKMIKEIVEIMEL